MLNYTNTSVAICRLFVHQMPSTSNQYVLFAILVIVMGILYSINNNNPSAAPKSGAKSDKKYANLTPRGTVVAPPDKSKAKAAFKDADDMHKLIDETIQIANNTNNTNGELLGKLGKLNTLSLENKKFVKAQLVRAGGLTANDATSVDEYKKYSADDDVRSNIKNVVDETNILEQEISKLEHCVNSQWCDNSTLLEQIRDSDKQFDEVKTSLDELATAAVHWKELSDDSELEQNIQNHCIDLLKIAQNHTEPYRTKCSQNCYNKDADKSSFFVECNSSFTEFNIKINTATECFIKNCS